MPVSLDLSHIAFKALQTEEGVARIFNNKKQALAFRARFYTFKAKELRHQRKIGSDITIYDDLGCSLEPTSDGCWRLTIKKVLFDGDDFIDAKTNAPIDWTSYVNLAKMARGELPASSEAPQETAEEVVERMRQAVANRPKRETVFGPPAQTEPRSPTSD